MILVPFLETLLIAVAAAVPSQEKRVHHHGDLSDHVHDDTHGYQYDHEAFLGKEEAKTFDQLTPEESKERLGKIVGRIDTDGDGFINHSELYQWIKHRQNRYIEEDVDKQWSEFDLNSDGQVSWAEYRNKTYGYFLDAKFGDPDEKASYSTMLSRDERRFKAADRNADGSASKQEMTAFLHPELYKHMQDIVVKETVEDIDQNGDGLINLQEYIGDMFSPEEGEVEPEWVTTEKQQFMDFRDVNKDGVLDASEIAKWILPGEMDHADNEAKHLIHETDTDKDGLLSLSEIMDKMEFLAASTITDYGDLMTKLHDEL